MPLDRKLPEYRAIEVLIDEDLRATLDRIVDESLDMDGAVQATHNLPGAHSNGARLRIALWLWNGHPPIEKRDVLCLDLNNRARFVRALEAQILKVKA